VLTEDEVAKDLEKKHAAAEKEQAAAAS
jgi:hypothetical protein